MNVAPSIPSHSPAAARSSGWSWQQVLQFLVVLFASLTLAAVVAARTGGNGEKNDTVEYQAHYACVHSLQESEACADTIGRSFDMLYYGLVRVSTLLFGVDGFYAFKLLVAFIVTFFIVYPAMRLSPVPLVTVALIASDFRFLEYSANVMRHGLALACFTTSLWLFARRPRWRLGWSRFLAAGFHFSALLMALVPARRLSSRALVLGLLATALVASQFELIAETLLRLGAGGDKLIYYFYVSSNNDEIIESGNLALALPLHYSLILLLGLLGYRSATSPLYVYLCNLMLVLTAAFLVIHQLSVAYRLLAFMIPFIAIVGAILIDRFSRRFGEYQGFARRGASSLVLLLCLGLFLKNLDAFVLHLR